MEMKIFCIKDTKVGFMQPFIQPNEVVAAREFGNLINNGSSVVSVNYQDMELYCLGTFNQVNGTIDSKEPSLICCGSDVKRVVDHE